MVLEQKSSFGIIFGSRNHDICVIVVYHLCIIWVSSWGHFGVVLGSSWQHFGFILGSLRGNRWGILFQFVFHHSSQKSREAPQITFWWTRRPQMRSRATKTEIIFRSFPLCHSPREGCIMYMSANIMSLQSIHDNKDTPALAEGLLTLASIIIIHEQKIW